MPRAIFVTPLQTLMEIFSFSYHYREFFRRQFFGVARKKHDNFWNNIEYHLIIINDINKNAILLQIAGRWIQLFKFPYFWREVFGRNWNVWSSELNLESFELWRIKIGIFLAVESQSFHNSALPIFCLRKNVWKISYLADWKRNLIRKQCQQDNVNEVVLRFFSLRYQTRVMQIVSHQRSGLIIDAFNFDA